MNTIRVVYATTQQQVVVELLVPKNSTVEYCIEASGILKQFPEIDLQLNKVGIYSKIVPLSQIVNAEDRIEIYRPLLVDPKEKRRQRALHPQKKSQSS